MRWRLISSKCKATTKTDRIAELDRRARSGDPLGVLAYLDVEPLGWCSIAPRESYGALERFKALAPIDDLPVWSAVCFFVDREVRHQGVTVALLTGAVEYAAAQGALVVEGLPGRARLAALDVYGFTGDIPPSRLRRRDTTRSRATDHAAPPPGWCHSESVPEADLA